jgi:hypothetical protein
MFFIAMHHFKIGILELQDILLQSNIYFKNLHFQALNKVFKDLTQP